VIDKERAESDPSTSSGTEKEQGTTGLAFWKKVVNFSKVANFERCEADREKGKKMPLN
jgi:hypothetical protein